MMPIEHILLIGSILLFLSVVASKISDKLGIPALLLFLMLGMAAGSEGIGKIYFNDPWAAKSLGIVALIFILFSGGLDTNIKDIRHVFWAGLSLSTAGVLATAILVGLFAIYALNFSPLEGFLLGAIVSSTDAATVFSTLRSKSVSLRGKLRPLIEFESGSNDPMAVFLTLGLIRVITDPAFSLVNLIPVFFMEASVGALIGYLMGRAITWTINRMTLFYEGLYPVITISLIIFTYTAATLLQGNGYLAVYIAGILAGNSNFVHKKSIMRFHEGLAWLMQIAMFLTLGLLVFPSKITPIIGIGLAISVFLMFIARPVSVFLCLALSRFDLREKTLASWVGLRGAVPIILATFPLIAKIHNADTIFNIVFFIVLTSILLQGTSIPMVSKWLKVDAPLKVKRHYPIDFEATGQIDASLEDVIVPYNSAVVGKPIFKINVPQDCLVVLISRDEKFFIPNGKTVINGGDVLLVLANESDLSKLQKIIQTPAN